MSRSRSPSLAGAAALLCFAASTQAAPLAPPCLTQAEVSAFDVAALKSEMMVVAETCDGQDAYNRLIEQYRPQFSSSERTLNTWFVHAYGTLSQRRQDDYVTQLANARSDVAIAAGQEMCSKQTSLFEDISASSGLEAVAAARHYAQPIRLYACGQDARHPVAIAYDAPVRPAPRHAVVRRTRHR